MPGPRGARRVPDPPGRDARTTGRDARTTAHGPGLEARGSRPGQAHREARPTARGPRPGDHGPRCLDHGPGGAGRFSKGRARGARLVCLGKKKAPRGAPGHCKGRLGALPPAVEYAPAACSPPAVKKTMPFGIGYGERAAPAINALRINQRGSAFRIPRVASEPCGIMASAARDCDAVKIMGCSHF